MMREDLDDLRPAPWDKKDDLDRLDILLDEYRNDPTGRINLAKNLETGRKVYIPLKQLSTHMHVLGSTGVGKSFFLEQIIKHLIRDGHGVCLIDPNGDLYERVLDYCVFLNMHEPYRRLEQRVVPFNIAESKHILGFNPVARNARVMTYQVLALIEAIRKVWGQDSFQDTPRLARWLYNTAYGVIDPKLTLLQAGHLLDPKPNVRRRAIIKRISNPAIAGEWHWLSELKDQTRNEFIESSYNRVRVFLQHEVLRLILGQYNNTIDFPSVLSERKILLINLAQQNVIPKDFQHLLGTLIVNELLTAAFARPRAARTPFYLFIDEFSNFVTKDMCEILDAGRKFGLHLILAHQHLAQLKIKDPEVYYSVMTNARIKAVFGGLTEEDLSILGPELINRELDPDEVKDEIWRQIITPVETTRTIYSSGTTESSSESIGQSCGEVTHQSLARGNTYIRGSSFLSPTSWGTPDSTSITSGSGSSNSSGHTSSSSSSYSSSTNKTEVPWYEYHLSNELSSRTFRSLEEQLFTKVAQLKDQPTKHVAILIPQYNVQWSQVGTLRDFSKLIRDRHRGEFIQACFELSGCFASPEQAQRELEAMEDNLLTETPPEVETKTAKVENYPQPQKTKSQTRTKPTKPNKKTPFDDLLNNPTDE